MRRKFSSVPILFSRDSIEFPKGYFFRSSPIDQERIVYARDVNEVNLNTFPASLIHRDKEVVFVKPLLSLQLELFAKENGIPIRNRTDIWAHISRPFLDTSFSASDTQQSEYLLSMNGITKAELRSIRRKAGRTFFLNIFYWESAYLGLFDYLSWTFITRKKYEWAMEIALRRNF